MRRWRTKGGIVIMEIERREELDRQNHMQIKVHGIRLSHADHGWLWLKKLTPVRSTRGGGK